MMIRRCREIYEVIVVMFSAMITLCSQFLFQFDLINKKTFFLTRHEEKQATLE